MSTVVERIAAHKSMLDAANEELSVLEARWNNGDPIGHTCEMQSALWQRITEVRRIVWDEIKAKILTSMGVDPSEWLSYIYDPDTNDVRYAGNG